MPVLPKPIADFTHPFRKGKPYAELAQKMNELRAKKSFLVSGPSYSGILGTNTLDVPVPLGLRILHWNIQDLGGGPSRGLERDEWVIERIARVISECDPDVVVILEVKQLGPRPKEPKRVVEVTRELRSKPGKNKVAEIKQRQDDHYDKSMEKYKKAIKRYEELSNSGKSTGLLQMNEIIKQLNKIGGPWGCIEFRDRLFTNGETYGFLVRKDLFTSTKCELLPDGWPTKECRAPGSAELTLSNGYMLNVVGFHAPAPSHGQVTRDAVEALARLDLTEFVLASDTNLSTDAEKTEEADKAMDSLFRGQAGQTLKPENTPVKLEFVARFTGEVYRPEDRYRVDGEWVRCCGTFVREGWNGETPDSASYTGDFIGDLQFFQASGKVLLESKSSTIIFIGKFNFEKIHGDPEEFFKGLNAAGGSFHDEPSFASGKFTGRTSLRKKVSAAPPPANGRYADTGAFNANAYDKLEHIRRKEGTSQFEVLASYTYPLFERCLPPSLHGSFEKLYIDRADVVDRIKTEALQPIPAVKSLQDALDAANQVSDHVPLILDLLIINGDLTVDHLVGARKALADRMDEEKPSADLMVDKGSFADLLNQKYPDSDEEDEDW